MDSNVAYVIDSSGDPVAMEDAGINTALKNSMGQSGFKHLTTAGTATYNAANMCCIQVLADCTVTCTSVNGDSLTGVTVTKGQEIVGLFSSVTCGGAGGGLLAYLA